MEQEHVGVLIDQATAQELLDEFKNSDIGQHFHPDTFRLERGGAQVEGSGQGYDGRALVEVAFSYRGEQLDEGDEVIIDLQTFQFLLAE